MTYGGTTYSVTTIGKDAFWGSSSLTSVAIPNSVTTIGMRAFTNCQNLANITIPNSVIRIGASAFDYTEWYRNQPSGMIYTGSVAYTYKGTIPQGTTISIKDGTLGIAESCFSYQSQLVGITIPNSVVLIDDAFYECTGLKRVNISGLTAWCNIDFVNEKANPLKRAHHLFLNGNEITDLVLPDSVTAISDYAFSGCEGLTSVTIPNSVSSIGNSAFSGCI